MTIQLEMSGDPFNISGYSSAMRDHIRALVSAGVDVRLTELRVNADRLKLDQWWTDHMPKMLEPLVKPKLAMHYTIAEMYKPNPYAYNIGFSYWEISAINDRWKEGMGKMDEIWSACQYALDVFRSCGVNKPTLKVPWPLSKQWFDYTEVKQVHPDQEKQFTFFSMGELTERKNFGDLIAAYCAEFQEESVKTDGSKQDGGTVLAIKTYHGLHNDPNHHIVIKTISNYRDRLQVKHRPKIILLTSVLPEPEMAAYMNSTDVFVYSTRGEGMGGPAIQMMALGKPLIAPFHTSIAEYHVSPWRVGYSMEPVHSMNHIPAYQGTNAEWARPDIGSLRECMRSAYELWRDDRKEFDAIGQEGREFVRHNLNYEKIGEIMRVRLEEL